MIVTRLAWIAHNLVSSNKPTRYASAASWKAVTEAKPGSFDNRNRYSTSNHSMDGNSHDTGIEKCLAVPTKETVACFVRATVTQPIESTTLSPTKIATVHHNTNDSYTEECRVHENPNDHRSNTKSRKKRQRKRPRSDWLMNEIGATASNTGTSDDVPIDTGVVVTRLDIIPQTSNDSASTPFLRIIYPYQHTFTTFCKARWIGHTILDVYSTEFGSYPESYYTIAIQQGRIRVSDQIVPIDYKLKAHDALMHTVHRHEPGVMVKYDTAPYVHIVEETADLMAIDKPSTLPVHSCGGYHRNSLMSLLHETYKNQKFYTIHRLDRLTSGLLVIAKNAKVAQEWGQAIQLRDCQKIYLARVKGHYND